MFNVQCLTPAHRSLVRRWVQCLTFNVFFLWVLDCFVCHREPYDRPCPYSPSPLVGEGRGEGPDIVPFLTLPLPRWRFDPANGWTQGGQGFAK